MKNKILISSLLITSLLLSACSNDSDRRSARETEAYTKSYDLADTDFSNGVTAEQYTDLIEYDLESPSAAPDIPLSQDNPNPVQDYSDSRMLIRRVTINAETENFDSMDALIRTKVAEYGGYFDSSNVSGTGKNYDYRRGTYVIRVPENNLDSIIEALGGNCAITARTENTEDVTLQYIDTQSQIESLRAEQEALLSMLSEADELEHIIVLQNELTSVRYQIESLESQLRALSNQVNYSTLTLSIEEVVEEIPEVETRTETYGDKVSNTWKDSLKSIKDFFANLFLGIVSISPILIAILVLTVITIIVIKRKLRKRKNAKIEAVTEVKVDDKNIENT